MNIFNLNPDQLSLLIQKLSKLITPNRWNLMQNIVKNRTRYLTLVLEDIYQSHNAAAVIRSCDGFGIQDIHVIENRNKLQIDDSSVSMGAHKWVDFSYYNQINTNNTTLCLNHLKEKNYKVVATTLAPNTISLDQLPIDQPLALMIGTEKLGLSPTAIQSADYLIQIPMYGFTQSYNLSVSAALCLYSISSRLHNSQITWQLPELQQNQILLSWLQKAINHWEKLIVDYN